MLTYKLKIYVDIYVLRHIYVNVYVKNIWAKQVFTYILYKLAYMTFIWQWNILYM